MVVSRPPSDDGNAKSHETERASGRRRHVAPACSALIAWSWFNPAATAPEFERFTALRLQTCAFENSRNTAYETRARYYDIHRVNKTMERATIQVVNRPLLGTSGGHRSFLRVTTCRGPRRTHYCSRRANEHNDIGRTPFFNTPPGALALTHDHSLHIYAFSRNRHVHHCRFGFFRPIPGNFESAS